MDNENEKSIGIPKDTVDDYIVTQTETSSYSFSSEPPILQSGIPCPYRRENLSISDNLRFEHQQIIKLKALLDALNAISVDQLDLLLSYTQDVEELMKGLADLLETLKQLKEFDRIFHLQKVNAGRFCIEVTRKNRDGCISQTNTSKIVKNKGSNTKQRRRKRKDTRYT